MSPGGRVGAGSPVAGPEWEHEVVLADGGSVFVRPVRPEDRDALERLHHRLSPESRYLRYFTARSRLPPAELERAVRVDRHDRMAFAALDGDELIGFGRYDRRQGSDAAEVAFEIDDAHQGRGLGTLLLEHLAAWAYEQGLRHLTAAVLPENRKMLDVFRDAGFPKESHYENGLVEVDLAIDPSQHARDVIAERHDLARRARSRNDGRAR